jgi:hypothetical protein
MISYYKNLWPSGANRWVVSIAVLWFATSCAWHFTYPGSNYKQSTDHATLYVSLFSQTRSRNITLWSCGLPVHCKPRGWWCIFHDIWINAALQWFSVTIGCNHFHLLFFPIKWSWKHSKKYIEWTNGIHLWHCYIITIALEYSVSFLSILWFE